ncbi:TPA: hypothetical protein ACJGJT_004063 [Salmonella enterica subsp. enterica serovar Chester]
MRDVPFVLMVIIFVFLFFAPESTWTVINQIWHHLRPLADREAVMLGKNISNILQLVWAIAAFSRFMLSLDEISFLNERGKDDR